MSFPVPKRAAYMKFPHPASGYAMTGVFVADTASGIRVAVTGAGPGVFRWKEAEAALGKNFSAAALESLSVKADDLIDTPTPAQQMLYGPKRRRVPVLLSVGYAACQISYAHGWKAHSSISTMLAVNDRPASFDEALARNRESVALGW